MKPLAEQPDDHVEAAIEAHFGGRIRPSQEAAMRAHLRGCDRCRRHYERATLVANLDPRALPAKHRLRRALGFAAPGQPHAGRAIWAGGAMLATVGLCLMLWPTADAPSSRAPHQGLQARGGVEVHGELRVVRVLPDDSVQLLDTAAPVTSEAELSVSYDPGGKPYVMVFAQDAAGAIHWYLPAWTDAGQDPTSVRVPDEAPPHTLDEAVSHPFSPGPMEVIAVFMDGPLSCRQVEAALKNPNAAPPVWRSATLLRHKLTVQVHDGR